jgi:hypothetical protein
MKQRERRPISENELKELKIYCIAHLGYHRGVHEFEQFLSVYSGKLAFKDAKLCFLSIQRTNKSRKRSKPDSIHSIN